MPPRDRSDRDQSGRVRSNEQKEKDRAQKQAKYVQDRAKKLLREKQEAKVTTMEGLDSSLIPMV